MDYLHLGEKALLEEKPLKALHYFTRAYEITQDSALLLEMAMLNQELGHLEDALSYYKKMALLDSEECRAYYGMATVYDEQDCPEQAILLYEKAIAINPLYDRAYFFLADLLDRIGDKNTAINYYQQLLDIVPDDFWGLTNLGSIYEELGQLDLCYHYFKKALALCPHDGIALFNMGVILTKYKRYTEAIHYYRKSLLVDKHYAYTYLNLAVLYKNNSELDLGIRVLSEGITYNEEAYLYYNRACFYALIQDFDASKRDLEVAFKLHPDFIAYSQTDDDLKDVIPYLNL